MAAAEQPPANLDFGAFAKAEEIKKRIWFTLGALVLYRIGVGIPLPGVHKGQIQHALGLDELWSAQAFTIMHLLTGGGFAQDSLLALGVLSIVLSEIFFGLILAFSPSLQILKKEGGQGLKQLNQYKRYLFLLIATAQAIFVVYGLEGSHRVYVVQDWQFRISVTSTLVAGATFLMWLSEQVSSRGVGNGPLLFLVAGLISALPEALFGKLLLVFVFPPTLLALICSAALGLSLFFIFALCEGAERRLLIQQATRQVGTTLLAGDARHLSLRLNSSGVMAPLCATLIMAMALESTRFARPYLGDAIADVLLLVSPLRPTGTVIYWLLIAFLHFFFTAVIINPTGTADALRRHGWFLPGIRPGNMTVEYIDYVGMRVAVIGSLYLPLVILAPHIAYIIGVDVGFGGLALLFIFIGISSLVTDIQRHLLAHQYEGLIKKAKLQGATRAR